MASKSAELTAPCLMCFETRVLKILSRCKHRFCTECMSIVFESQERGNYETFACPTCKVICPLPLDGVEGLITYTEEDTSDADTELAIDVGTKAWEKVSQCPEIQINIKCQICRHKKKDVEAVNVCLECGHFYYCQDCTDVHAQNKATRNHTVTLFKKSRDANETVVICKLHDTELTSYCRTCDIPVCTVCVMLDHGNHTVDNLGDTICKLVYEIEGTLEEEEWKVTEIQQLEKEMKLLKAMAPVIDKQDVLIKDIEDHAQKCFDQIVAWKNNLKQKVTMDYKLIQDIPTGLDKVSKRVKKMQGPISRAIRLLTETKENDPEYLEKLKSLQKDWNDAAEIEDDIDGREYRCQLVQLYKKDHTFTPEIIPLSFGTLDANNIDLDTMKLDDMYEFEPTEIFHHTMYVDSEDIFIPCVASLGRRFAVAHPTRTGEPSDAIDIYKYPGTLEQTFSFNVPPLYDMTSTPDGNLAVLSDGCHHRGGCSVKLFDPTDGYLSSTRDIDIAKPLSLGVTLHHQYVILGENSEGQTQITLLNKDGIVELIHMTDEEKTDPDLAWPSVDMLGYESYREMSSDSLSSPDYGEDFMCLANEFDFEEHLTSSSNECEYKEVQQLHDFGENPMLLSNESDLEERLTLSSNEREDEKVRNLDQSLWEYDAIKPNRITCGGRFIFTSGKRKLAIYEVTDTGLQKVTTSINPDAFVTDISATLWDEFLVANTLLSDLRLDKYSCMYDESESDWLHAGCRMVKEQVQVRMESRLSVGNGHIVFSHGPKIRIYKLDTDGFSGTPSYYVS